MQRRRRYAELHCTTNFSFLQGGSHPEELVSQAAALGYTTMTLTEQRPPVTSVLSSVPYAVDGSPEWLLEEESYNTTRSDRLLDLLEQNVRQNSHLFPSKTSTVVKNPRLKAELNMSCSL